jgi:hypothetical protein
MNVDWTVDPNSSNQENAVTIPGGISRLDSTLRSNAADHEAALHH